MKTNRIEGDDRLYGKALHMLVYETVNTAVKPINSEQISNKIIAKHCEMFGVEEAAFTPIVKKRLLKRVRCKLRDLSETRFINRKELKSSKNVICYEYFGND